MMNNLQNNLIQKARSIINLCDGKSRHVSFIVKKKKILSVGYNLQNTTHTLAYKFGYWNSSIHSELMAISKFKYDYSTLSNCIIYNIRIDRYQNIVLSKPCKNCKRLLKHFNIRCVFFTDELGAFSKLIL